MHPTHFQLCTDHDNLVLLLNTLEAELALYEAGEGRQGRLSLILDIFDYARTYPEKWHHPIEEALFTLLLKQSVECSAQIWAVRAEHKVLEDLARHASELFNAVANDCVVPLSKLIGTSKHYIRRQREHIQRENGGIYPLFQRHINKQEWDAVTESVVEKGEDAYQAALCNEYRLLRRAVLRGDRAA